ncbi:glycoside hydrolase family 35 protein [Dinghuibacter silviterrae]|uniref:Beta-galactosidase n=1 Tax=Dinghuibacter silviterrae TaxID=1539049 RepID=A0A4R8DKJ6_9BACT|nr:beta-galactosidase family protein [Dinghuibacter silviterrae]TDW97530.1 beta-galactosidase/beta-galactosidase [Dinghuibacter silviterrae]
MKTILLSTALSLGAAVGAVLASPAAAAAPQTPGAPRAAAAAQKPAPRPAPHTFHLGPHDFLLDGKPFQIISGEMHPARIPRAYWRQRIRMAKAMGCNTIAAYVFWNYLETSKGRFDFRSENRDIAAFIRIAQEEKMWVLLRPGPYVCAEWDFGGLPDYLLSIPGIKVRCADPRYMDAVKRYVKALTAQVDPLLVTHGGPILMVQLENEYGSYGNDKNYLETLRKWWVASGIDVPFYTADGAAPSMLEAGNVNGAAIGLDPGVSEDDFAQAAKRNPDVPSFSSETYPGWLTHWGEKWATTDTDGICKEVKFLLDTKRSFNLYVIHGGTNFGFTAGANSGGKGFEPDVTSYDYDAPVNEQGQATPKYMALRRLIGSYTGSLPDIPAPVPVMSIPAFTPAVWTSVWNTLPQPVVEVQPEPFEALGQNQGLMLYTTRLIGHKSGRLTLTDLHDYATVFVDGKYIGYLDRREGKKSIELPKPESPNPLLEVLVEGMGHINFAQEMIDPKGITERVTLDGMTLMNWKVYPLPLNDTYMRTLRTKATPPKTPRPGMFFKGSVHLDSVADTYLDLSHYQKGVVWVNGHNLGRFWNIGPQQHLYCPAPWLKKGDNEVIIFDQLQTEPAPVSGVTTLQ